MNLLNFVLQMKYSHKVSIVFLAILLIGFLIPERKALPVEGASKSDWNSNSFWYEPWGSSGVHKGIDIFANRGRPVVASTDLIVIYSGQINKGGNVVLGLGPKWRLHYFAHLDDVSPDTGLVAARGQQIGSVGDTGNAKGKQPHLHYSIFSLIPLPWLMDTSLQGYKKAFYLDPIAYFEDISNPP